MVLASSEAGETQGPHLQIKFVWDAVQTRRAALLERESALQRWAVQLELEGAKQAAAGKALQQQLQKVRQSCLRPVLPCKPWQGLEGSDLFRQQRWHSLYTQQTLFRQG